MSATRYSAGPFPAVAADLTDQFVLQRCDYFTSVQLWPLRKEMNARVWLSNFDEDIDRQYARYLLNAFIYFEHHVTHRLLEAAFQALSRLLADPSDPATIRRAWSDFLHAAIVAPVAGEVPRPTDSGYSFARLARDLLGIEEDRILDPPKLAKRIEARPAQHVVFLDDFVGSGDQFIDSWHRLYPTSAGGASSFRFGRARSFRRRSQPAISGNAFICRFPSSMMPQPLRTTKAC